MTIYKLPNQRLKSQRDALGTDRMSVGAINMANRGLVLNNSVGCVNLFPWVQYETIQRGELSRNPLGASNYMAIL